MGGSYAGSINRYKTATINTTEGIDLCVSSYDAEYFGGFRVLPYDGSSYGTAEIYSTSASGNVYIRAYSGINGYIQLVIESTSGGYVGPVTDKVTDLGRATYAWDNAYADDWNNVADFYFLDTRDDLKELHKIKGSGIIDENSGLELIDDNSLPTWLLTRNKVDSYNDETKRLVGRKGETAYDLNGKPYISLKTAISWIWGMIKQGDIKFENHLTKYH
jgi:hypothetical protein